MTWILGAFGLTDKTSLVKRIIGRDTMRNSKLIITGLLVATGGATLASLSNAATNQTTPTSASDLGRLSTKGAEAFTDITLARAAIFNGHTAQAQTLVKNAQKDLKIAARDNTAFTEAASRLTSPPGDSASPPKSASTEIAVAWLPVGADITIADNFAPKPDKAAAVASANRKLKSGQPASAMQTLKLADIKIAYTMAVVPMNQTIASVDDAATLIASDRYYQADQKLKSIQDSERYDRIALDATPKVASTGPASETHTSPSK